MFVAWLSLLIIKSQSNLEKWKHDKKVAITKIYNILFDVIWFVVKVQ